MNNPTTDAGLIQVLLEKLEKQRLPKILALNEKVNAGESLDEATLDGTINLSGLIVISIKNKPVTY